MNTRTGREPLELASQADLDSYAAIFGLEKEIVRLARKCPECEEAILVCWNSVWLDAKPVPGGDWGVMKLGPYAMAASGGHAHPPRASAGGVRRLTMTEIGSQRDRRAYAG